MAVRFLEGELKFFRAGLFSVTAFFCAASFSFATPELARKSDAFVDSIGINTHFGNSIYTGGNAYADPRIDAELGALGIRRIRDHSWNDEALAKEDGLFNAYGIKATLILGETTRTPTDLVNLLKAHAGYEGIEGLNEPDFNTRSYNGFTDNPATHDYSATKAYQNDMYAAVKGDPFTASRTIYSPAMGSSLNSQYLVPINFDIAAMHSYPSGLEPSNALDTNISRMATLRGSKPLASTETGYYNLPAADVGSIPENVAGKYMLRLYGEYFNRGTTRVYPYELADQGPDTTDKEQNFGLLHFDMSEKPAYVATKNLLNLLKEPNAGNYSPQSLDYTITSASSLASVHHTLLQKADGRFYLMLWQEATSYNRTSETEINVAPISATLSFGNTFGLIRMYLPNDSAAEQALYLSTNSINLNILDKMTVVELSQAPEPGIGLISILMLASLTSRKDRKDAKIPK